MFGFETWPDMSRMAQRPQVPTPPQIDVSMIPARWAASSMVSPLAHITRLPMGSKSISRLMLLLILWPLAEKMLVLDHFIWLYDDKVVVPRSIDHLFNQPI